MTEPKILAVVLAGGEGGRLGALTESRAKPAVSFGGSYRLIDFALSNLQHSKMSDVWIVEGFRPYELNRHLSNGRPWDLDRDRGGLVLMPPFTGDEKEGFAHGNADALHRQAEFIRKFEPDVLLTLSADGIYRMDFRDLVARHLEQKAEVTMATVSLPGEDVSRFGVVRTEDDRVVGFDYKPDKPKSDVVTAEVFAYDPKVALDLLDRLAETGELKDYGDKLIPALVERGKAFEFRHEGYWRDVGTPSAFLAGHLDLLGDHPDLNLDDPVWPIHSAATVRLPAKFLKGASAEDSLIASGAVIGGRVVRSVVGPGATVPAGVTVTDSVLLPDSRAEADLTFAILNEGKSAREAAEGTREEPVIVSPKED